jgi:hypothetical protein
MTDALPDPDARIDALVRTIAAAKSAKLDRHPEPDELVDFHLGALSAADRERIEEHITFCPECAQVVLDLAQIVTPLAADQQPNAPELDPEWRRLLTRLERSEPRPSSSSTHSAASRKSPWALAASLLLSAGLLGWAVHLRRELEITRQPQTGVALVDLEPATRGAQRSEERPRQVRLAPGVAKLVVVLDLGDLRTFPRYGLKLLAPDGRVLWRTEEARRADDGTFVFEIPRTVLREPGIYRIEVEGRHGNEAVQLAGYSLMVVGNEPASR